MKLIQKIIFNTWPLIVVACVLATVFICTRSLQLQTRKTVLLIPSKQERDHEITKIWLAACQEEGVDLSLMTDREFIWASFFSMTPESVILPDSIHQKSNSLLINQIHRYVENGGKLFLTYDALTMNHDSTFSDQNKLSDLVGANHPSYNQFKKELFKPFEIYLTPHGEKELNITPGKFAAAPWSLSDDKTIGYKLISYQAEFLTYSIFQTTNIKPADDILLASNKMPVARIWQLGKGKVLWVNLPIAYLKSRTDGLLLHRFINFWADRVIQAPRLLTTPNGIGGVVLNLHIDSNASLKPIELLTKNNFFEHGPFSIHITAGPAARQFGDNLGLNVDKNLKFKKWILYALQKGHTIGDHGGWIHDYFGKNIKEQKTEEFVNYLNLNNSTLEQVAQKQLREYSAPIGNQPRWVTKWLSENGFNSYYFTGNMGMGPTRTFRDGEMDDQNGLWSYPVNTYGRAATFEEAAQNNIPTSDVSKWLNSMISHTANTHEVRLIYFHPSGAEKYLTSLEHLLETAEIYRTQKKFSWYTMSEHSDFLNKRINVKWKTFIENNSELIQVENAFDGLAWKLPPKMKVQIINGQAEILYNENETLVIARQNTELLFRIVSTN